MTRYYHVDPYTLTFGRLLSLIEQLPRVRMWEAGKNPDASPTEGLDSTELAEKVVSGEIDINEALAGIKKSMAGKSNMTDAEKQRENARIDKIFNPPSVVIGEKI